MQQFEALKGSAEGVCVLVGPHLWSTTWFGPRQGLVNLSGAVRSAGGRKVELACKVLGFGFRLQRMAACYNASGCDMLLQPGFTADRSL